MDEYLNQFQEYKTRILCRKKAVEEMIQEWHAIGCNCESRPDAPCCLLHTEYELLARYADVLDRELWHLEHKND